MLGKERSRQRLKGKRACGFEGQQEGWRAESILGEELRSWKYEERIEQVLKSHCNSLDLG